MERLFCFGFLKGDPGFCERCYILITIIIYYYYYFYRLVARSCVLQVFFHFFLTTFRKEQGATKGLEEVLHLSQWIQWIQEFFFFNTASCESDFF